MDIDGTWLKEKKTHVGESNPKQISPFIQSSMVVQRTQTVCYRNALYLVLQPKSRVLKEEGLWKWGAGTSMSLLEAAWQGLAGAQVVFRALLP